MTQKSIFLIAGVVVLASIALVTSGLYAKTCSCYDEEDVVSACYTGEYVGARVTSSYCDYNLCIMTFNVRCYDKVEKEPYFRTAVTSKECVTCSGGGGGVDPFPIWN